MKKLKAIWQMLNVRLLKLLIGVVFFTVMVRCAEKRAVEKGNENVVSDSVYIQQGARIAALSFDTLRNSLLNAIAAQGMEGAITFCNEKAYALTATYADSVVIRRTSLRYRNPVNKPDSLELAMLTAMHEEMSFSNTPAARLVRQQSTEDIHFFKPILTQSMCLNCHGTARVQVHDNTLARIQKLYPEDRAMNFQEGDLRGVWHIIFKPKRKK